jgi:hypothetical protein
MQAQLNIKHPLFRRLVMLIRHVINSCLLVLVCYATPAIESQVTITVRDGVRIIEANGIPNHSTGTFPNANNPHRIQVQRHRFSMPEKPQMQDRIVPFPLGVFGIAINGVPFDPGAAEFWKRDPHSGWQYDALSGGVDLGMDEHHAHVQPNGAYHYHGLPTGLIEKLGGTGTIMRLIGWAADGFPIYASHGHHEADNAKSPVVPLRPSYRLRVGERQNGPDGKYDGRFVEDWEYIEGFGDLDACNGRTGVTPEFPTGTYYYVITSTFPFIPRAWHGVPDRSFLKHMAQRPHEHGRPEQFAPPPDGRRPPPRDGRRTPPPDDLLPPPQP